NSRKEYEVVESIEYKGYNEIEVYNLIVENYHTFFITELGLKVHNIDCKNATLGQIFKQVGDNISDTKIKGDFEDVIKKLDDIAERNNIEEYIKNFDSRFRGLDPNNLDEIKKIISDTSKDIDNHSSSLFKGTEGVTQADIRERVLKNIEESKIAREASNYQEFAKIDTKIYAENNNWVDKAGNIIWPPNRGFDGEAVIETLKPGTRIDRYGFEGGTFVSPEGIPYPSRALAPGTENKSYNVYEVIKPIEVQAGKIAPWFGEPGGGIQYELSLSVKKLIEDGFIRRVEIK
ncbi:TNT domain-containing protein, partial [Clostridium sp.]|uniref:TNT domain-containing protein n=1 Tax=Clostridium sp. TaxID=1506 RepID=UPI001D69B1AA